MQMNNKFIAAARQLLGWDQQELADRVGVSRLTIVNAEKHDTKPSVKTWQAVIDIFEREGVIIKDNSISFQNSTSYVITDEKDWFVKLLEDAYLTLRHQPNAELLIEMSDDRMSPPEVVGQYRKIRNADIKMRQLVEHGNSYMMAPVQEYRWLPENFFSPWISLIYGNKVAYKTKENAYTVYNEENLANKERKKFNLLWDLLDQPNVKSTADVFF